MMSSTVSVPRNFQVFMKYIYYMTKEENKTVTEAYQLFRLGVNPTDKYATVVCDMKKYRSNKPVSFCKNKFRFSIGETFYQGRWDPAKQEIYDFCEKKKDTDEIKYRKFAQKTVHEVMVDFNPVSVNVVNVLLPPTVKANEGTG